MRMQESASWEILGGKEYYSKKSDDHGFLVFAEDAAEGVGDFADGGVGFDGGEDGGEEIFGSGGAGGGVRERRFWGGGGTPWAGGGEGGGFGAVGVRVGGPRG